MSDRNEELPGANDPADSRHSAPLQPDNTVPPSDSVAHVDQSSVDEPVPVDSTTDRSSQEPAEPGLYDNLTDSEDVERQPTTGDEVDGVQVDEDADDEYAQEDEPRRPNIALLIGGLLLLVLIGGGIGLFATRWSAGGGSGQAIARVGETEITRGEFTRSWSDGQDAQAVLDQIIDFELVVQAARNEGATVDTAAIDQQVEQIKAQNGNDEAQFQTFLQENQIDSEANLRSLMERQQLVEAMVMKHTTVEQARASHILLGGDSPEAIEARKAEAEDLLKQLQDGADFKALAAEKSEDPGSKDNGGDLGWAPHGIFVPAFDEAIFSMQPGELRLVQSDFGWHIIKLESGPEVRGLENQDYFQTPPVMEAFNTSFLPWVEGLRTTAEQQGAITVLVEPTQLVPTAAPIAPEAPPQGAPDAPAPEAPAQDAPAPTSP